MIEIRTKEEAVELLRLRIEESGLSAGEFARHVLLREPRTVRRWNTCESPIPKVVVEWLQDPRIAPWPRSEEGSRPHIICLCGSSRFVDTMAVLAWQLEKRGNIVLSLHLLPAWYNPSDDHQAEAEGVADFMDELHLRKIDLADEVIVVDVNEYIGESTSREIQYAKDTGTELRYLSKELDLLALPARSPQKEG